MRSGVYPASVTPFAPDGTVDYESLARLLAYFEAAGCAGVVVAGTNGEGPSLGQFEKRDLVREAVRLAGGLEVVLGVATPSLDDACWLVRQAGKSGAAGVLVMPPGYFRQASEAGVEDWFRAVADAATAPVLLYNYPKMTGVNLGAGLVERLAAHPNVAGLKDSSGDRANLADYRRAMPDTAHLYVGDETLLRDALAAGWSGTISGAANLVPQWLARVVRETRAAGAESVQGVWGVLLPVLEAVRAASQPVANKATLAGLGVIASDRPRLPLVPGDDGGLIEVLRGRLGVRPDNLALPLTEGSPALG